MSACPVCGRETVSGKILLVGRGGLQWIADAGIPRKRPLRVFGRALFATKRLAASLRAFDWYQSERDAGAPGWYCFNCKKIFAIIDVPDLAFNMPPDSVCAPTLSEDFARGVWGEMKDDRG